MGPTNVALVRLYEAELELRAAAEKLESASRSVRIQERRIKELTEKLDASRDELRHHQAKAGEFELDIKSRDGKIEKLRTQQQQARNHKEYQAFIAEINTEKTDRAKVEDDTLREFGEVERLSNEVKELTTQLGAEQKSHQTTQEHLAGKLAELQAEIDRLQPVRDEAAAAVPERARKHFERICERYEGESMAAIAKPNRRHEEYVCTGCHMALFPDVYNQLHQRDEPVACPNCGRLLFIPDDLPPELAINKKKSAEKPVKNGKKKGKEPAAEQATEASQEEQPPVAETPKAEA